jgi:hypothetical protein
VREHWDGATREQELATPVGDLRARKHRELALIIVDAVHSDPDGAAHRGPTAHANTERLVSKRVILEKLARATLLATLVAACTGGDAATEAQSQTPVPETPAASGEAAEGRAVSAREVAAKPHDYFGRVVAVSGPAFHIFDESLYSLDEDRARSGPDVLVVSPRPIHFSLPGETLTVEGRVRPYVREELKSEFGLHLTRSLEEVEGLVEGLPVVIAESVRSADGTEW